MTRHFTQKEVIDAIYEARGIVTVAARKLRCDRDVIHRWVKADCRVSEAMERANEYVADEGEEVLYQMAIEERNLDALKVLLKAKAKRRGYADQITQSSNAVIDLWLEEISNRQTIALPVPANQLELQEAASSG